MERFIYLTCVFVTIITLNMGVLLGEGKRVAWPQLVKLLSILWNDTKNKVFNKLFVDYLVICVASALENVFVPQKRGVIQVESVFKALLSLRKYVFIGNLLIVSSRSLRWIILCSFSSPMLVFSTTLFSMLTYGCWIVGDTNRNSCK